MLVFDDTVKAFGEVRRAPYDVRIRLFQYSKAGPDQQNRTAAGERSPGQV